MTSGLVNCSTFTNQDGGRLGVTEINVIAASVCERNLPKGVWSNSRQLVTFLQENISVYFNYQ